MSLRPAARNESSEVGASFELVEAPAHPHRRCRRARQHLWRKSPHRHQTLVVATDASFSIGHQDAVGRSFERGIVQLELGAQIGVDRGALVRGANDVGNRLEEVHVVAREAALTSVSGEKQAVRPGPAGNQDRHAGGHAFTNMEGIHRRQRTVVPVEEADAALPRQSCSRIPVDGLPESMSNRQRHSPSPRQRASRASSP